MKTVSFGIIDYIRMYKKHGLRLPLKYFFENHLYDLVNNVDTHTWQPQSLEAGTPVNRDHGIIYMASWKSVIKKSTIQAQALLNTPLSQVIDVGCGKGKVLCIWEKLYKNTKTEIIGIEYDEQLIKICKNNLKKVNAQKSRVYMEDAALFDSNMVQQNTIIFLYNPFDEVILDAFLKSLPKLRLAVVYVNPVHAKLFEKYDFNTHLRVRSWHPTGSYIIFHRS